VSPSKRMASNRSGLVAVIGMGCRLPGDVDSPAALWNLLMSGQDAVALPTPERAAQLAPHAGVPIGGYLRDVGEFDAEFFGVSGREADVLDPQHRLLLEVAWEALENAGLPPNRLAGTQTGVFVGLSYNDYMDRLTGLPQELEGSILTNGHCVAAGRISYLLGLHGPCLALDTACSSSLVSVHLACQSLLMDECDYALAGGVNLMLQPRTALSFDRMGMLSPTGRCHTFDADADGFVRGEGCGVVVLKHLKAALRDGDRVLAVIRGSAVNQDGRSDGLAAPSGAAQQAVISEALRRASVDPREVGLVETHGTGTPVGDPVEFASLARIYGKGRGGCALGSVKTNIGHLEPAAGITGLIKAVLCLQHEAIPGNLHFNRWNPAIAPQGTRLFVPTRRTQWPVQRPSPRLAAVSSFGFSGTNAHVVLQRASRRRRAAWTPGSTAPAAPVVLVVPAGSGNVLPEAAGKLADWLETDGAQVPLHDVAHTLALRRSPGRGRLGVVAHSAPEAITALRSFAAGREHPAVVAGELAAAVSRRPVWVFSGHGSQWPGMGRLLLETEPAFATALNGVDRAIMHEAGFSVIDLINSGEPITDCGRVQPVVFALQLGLAATWRAHGVEPAAVIGHSMGEVAAAVVAGALSLEDGVRVICLRSALLRRIAGTGAMASVGLDVVQVQADLAERGATSVSVAVMAAPHSTVVAGDPEQIEHLVAYWQQKGVAAMPVAVDVASHSPQVDPLLNELANGLSGLHPQPPAVPVYSTVSDEPRALPDFDAAYWCANLRQPVRFAAAVAAAAEDRNVVFVEVSPHPIAAHALKQTLEPLVEDALVLPTLRRDEPESTTFAKQLAALHCAGVEVGWSRLYGNADLADVPAITYDRRRHWFIDSPTSSAAQAAQRTGTESVLAGHTLVPGAPVRHTWRANVGTARLPWLADHRVLGSAVLPGAVYCAIALNAGCEVFDVPHDQVEIADLTFHEMLSLGADTELGVTVSTLERDRAECEMFAQDESGQWVRHASVSLRRSDTPPRLTHSSPTSLALKHQVTLDVAAVYAGLRAGGLEHGPAFTGLTRIQGTRGASSIWGHLRLPDSAATHTGGLRVHPVLLDMALQLMVAGVNAAGAGLILPVRMRAARILGDPSTAAYCHASITETSSDTVIAHARLLDESGSPVAILDGVRFARRSTSGTHKPEEWLLETGWHPTPRPSPPPAEPAGDWLLVGEGVGDAEALAAELRSRGARTEVWEVPLQEDRREQLRSAVHDRMTTGPDTPVRSVVMMCRAPEPGTANEARAVDDALGRTGRLLDIAQAITQGADSTRLYAVTCQARRTSPAETADLGQGALRGLVRVLAMEHPEMRATLVDIDGGAAGLANLADELVSHSGDDEIALRGPDRLVCRLAYAPPGNTPAEAVKRPVRYGKDRFQLRAGRLGDLSSLELAGFERKRPGPGEIEIRVEAAGMNFRDVLTAMGLLPGDGDVRKAIGFECAGVVVAVGTDVRHLRIGDRVFGSSMTGGCFASFVLGSADAFALVPEGLGPIAAAGLPIAFMTAWHALRHTARLSPGERVLIHSASGGTGLAAVACAQRLGAEVVATAGSEEKRRYLRGLGIEHVLNSRSLDFPDRIREVTGGGGVDVVLNSLSGPAIRAGLESLNPFGRFVELGVRDILADAPLGMGLLRHNITVSAVDLIGLRRNRPTVFAKLLREVVDEITLGRVAPLWSTTFPLEDAPEAFRLMAGAGHIGKLVLTMPDHGETTAVPVRSSRHVRRGSAYVVTGGLRGLGLATAEWLARQGAARIVLNGRTPPSCEAAQTIGRLVAQGVEVDIALGDIGRRETAERLVATATENGHSLRGIAHCAMVLDDAAITNIRDEQLRRVWRPKVMGAWHLHTAAAKHTLDWFAVFSSMASLIGNPGQGAYAAANAWLDSFAHWRSGQGLPTLAVNWGPWGQVGAATDFSQRGYDTIPTEAGLDALGMLLSGGRVQTGVIPGSPASWVLPAVRNSSFFGLVAPDGATTRPAHVSDSGIRETLHAASPGLPRRTALEKYLADHIRLVLRLGGALDPQTPLTSLGFDSLLAMELRARLESELDVRLPGDFVWRHPTVAALADGLAERMGMEL
jgi:acyl transferase domain-containing protein/NADPH:quinone reductase-like Zn-dependent oxidoreductase/acyl carrier protein